MKHLRNATVTTLRWWQPWAGALLLLLLLGFGHSWAQTTEALDPALHLLSIGLKERAVLPKPQKTFIDVQRARADVIVLKFREGTQIRWRGNQWAVNSVTLSLEDARLLQRANLDRGQVELQLAAVNAQVAATTNLQVERLFTRPEGELEQEKRDGEFESNEELADLNLYYYLFLKEASLAEAEALIDDLNALDIGEIAYAQPHYALPLAYDQPATPGVTPSFVSEQGYLEVANSPSAPASNGIDARYAWTLNGGRGDAVRIIDVEYDWRDGHEDLPAVFYNSGVRGVRSMDQDELLADRNHGTAVLGVIRAIENTFGTTGIVPNSNIGFSAAFRQGPVYDVADAINRAQPNLNVGDILLIEQQTSGPTGMLTCDMTCGNCNQFGMIPVEWEQAIFDAIRSLTTNGRIVVEAGGNGQMNLDDARYEQRFDRTFRDSRAIIVGAGTSNGRAPFCWSSAGNRVDVQGWGQNVVTEGYGDRYMGAAGETQWYTRIFRGTSSASPIVTGAAAAVQGVRRARGLTPLNAQQMRDLLRMTGRAQGMGRQVGPLPNLNDAIALYVNPGYMGLSFGTPAEPYQTLPAALSNAWNVAQIIMVPATYPVPGGFVSQRVTLRSTGGTVTIVRQ